MVTSKKSKHVVLAIVPCLSTYRSSSVIYKVEIKDYTTAMQTNELEFTLVIRLRSGGYAPPFANRAACSFG
jgi:hypothetical protein